MCQWPCHPPIILRNDEDDDPDSDGAARILEQRKAPHPNRGSLEFSHSMVMTACVHVKDSLGTCKEEVVLPPQELASTKSEHIGCALLRAIETHLFGRSLDVCVAEMASKFSGLSFVTTGDAASANVKTTERLFCYLQALGREHAIPIVSIFTSCNLHQLSRILGLQLERQALTSALYSITRLQQHRSTQQKTRDMLKKLLRERFVYTEDIPPFCPFTRARFRNHLLSILSGVWDGEAEVDLSLSRAKLVEEALNFFNGDLSNTSAWTHHCHGCHDSYQAALQHVPRTSYPSHDLF